MTPKAEQAKLAGNAAFKAGQWELALAHYSTAIQLDPSVATYPLNRAAVHLRLDNPRDADKDASTALALQGGHSPKALFRRATARKQLGKLELARADFEEAKRQGAGDDVNNELALLATQLDNAKVDKPAPPKATASNKSNPVSPPEPPRKATSPSTERLRAALAPPVPSSSPSKSSSAKPANDGFMTAVSSRRLTSSAPATPPSAPAPAASAASPEPGSRPASSFAAKKQARTAKQAQPPRQASDPRARDVPAPHAPLASPDSSNPAPPTSSSPQDAAPLAQPAGATPPPPAASTSSASAPSSSTDDAAPASLIPSAFLRPTSSSAPPPPSATALETHFLLTPPGASTRLALLCALDPRPSSLRAFFGAAGVQPDLLSAILAEVLPLALAPAGVEQLERDTEWVPRLLEGLSATARWDAAVLFLDEGERDGVRRVLEKEEARWRRARDTWGV
ncbi:hypothetical protein JCM3775_006980 [Rhodotorula graminis]